MRGEHQVIDRQMACYLLQQSFQVTVVKTTFEMGDEPHAVTHLGKTLPQLGTSAETVHAAETSISEPHHVELHPINTELGRPPHAFW